MSKTNYLSLSRDLILDVIQNDSVFAVAMKNLFKKYNLLNDEKNIISSLAGCELRHHLIFEEIVKNHFGELNLNIAVSLYVALANVLFVKKVDELETLLFVYKTFDENNLSFSQEDIKSFFEKSKQTNELIPSQYDKTSIEFLSLRFNTPKWLVKMWRKIYGEALTYKILKANSKPPLSTCAINIYESSIDEILEKPELFEKGFVENTVNYLGKSPIKKQSFVLKNKIYPQKLSIKHALDNVDFDPFRGIAVYQGTPSNIYLDAIMHTNNIVNMDLIVASYEDYYESKDKIKTLNLKNTQLYRNETNSFITCISKPVHTFIVSPKSSNFDLLKSAPDYFLHFNSETFDSLINDQYACLESASEHIEDGGQLIYLIPTISQKEGQLNVRKFIKNNKNFVIELERQYLPFDPYNSSLYFVILRKVKKLDD